MFGSACEADRAVRDALTRTADAGGADALHSLIREIFGRALSVPEQAVRHRRETPSGPWLPEPVLTGGGALGELTTAGSRESVSMARLVALERLTPAERAAFVLTECFGYGSAEIAAVLGLSETQCRTLRRRARQRVPASAPGVEPPAPQRWRWAEDLLRAAARADQAALTELLADDVVAWSDGGGVPGTVRRPVLGAAKVGRVLARLITGVPPGTRGRIAEINGDAALLATAGDTVVGVVAPEFGPLGLVGIRTVADPGRLVFVNRQWSAADRPAD
ncbi:sigma factor-like helix-turn-helix DNA-binding protein [Actinacidiphila alni]|uniref:sigma factor-like helix-turn-helix DNA-binding protein n=1 Tax=Actinacidiphila alni TaxID=380248 RepID=UPI0034549200